jgi:hypothetical protein
MVGVSLPAGSENTWRGAFGEGWFRTICTVAGCTAAKLDPDVVGTDFMVHDQDCEIIRVQVKATGSPTTTAGGYSYALDVATYDRLRRGSTPGYLVVVVVHVPHPKWTGHTGKGSLARASAYWAKIAGLPAVTNVASATVSLPLGNMLTPAKLLGLFQ